MLNYTFEFKLYLILAFSDTTKRIQELESELKKQLENINTKQEMILILQNGKSSFLINYRMLEKF